MSAVTTIIHRLRVIVHKKSAVRFANRGLLIYLEKKTYGRPGVAIP